MDATRVALVREVLASTGWLERTSAFTRRLCRSTREPGGLLLVGTPGHEPWHLASHLEEESRWHDLPQLLPTLVRWSPAPGAPEHPSAGTRRIEVARRGESVFVVSPESPPPSLLERVAAARRRGATIFALDSGDRDFAGIAHEVLAVPRGAETVSFEAVQHLVSSAAAASRTPQLRGLRARLARLLGVLSGPALPH